MRKNTIWNYSFIFICCVLKSINSLDHGTHTVSVVSNRYNTQHQFKQNPNVASRHSSHEAGQSLHNSQSEPSAAASPSMSHVTHIAASHAGSGGEHSTHLEHNLHRSSYNLLSEAMSQAVSNEFSSI
ncbi:stromal interaction molecule homolog isoform X3 [Drosophila eugracilis]|uniref:stromal interaction molecule homolog isoform X3 n=1 Tax=Drosophila eugracilis TaxID=29029 RepID=UPI0007E64F73|nr:stromal interaction molecule homolog isoform X3 [Drosophila eugracilis]